LKNADSSGIQSGLEFPHLSPYIGKEKNKLPMNFFLNVDSATIVGYLWLRRYRHRTKSTIYEAKMSQTSSSISEYDSTPSDPSTMIRELEDKLYRWKS
jgi:hypothetical protein